MSTLPGEATWPCLNFASLPNRGQLMKERTDSFLLEQTSFGYIWTSGKQTRSQKLSPFAEMAEKQGVIPIKLEIYNLSHVMHELGFIHAFSSGHIQFFAQNNFLLPEMLMLCPDSTYAQATLGTCIVLQMGTFMGSKYHF